MGSLLRNTWVIVSVWCTLVFTWWIFMPVVAALYGAVQPYASTSDMLWALDTMMFAWSYFPVILTFVVVIWAVWASTRPDVETSATYYGY